MSDELKPCPFCGGRKIDQTLNPQCESCGAKVATVAQWDFRPIEDALRRALEHERQCERNPMVNELAEKDAEIERLRDAITEHIKEAYCHIDLVYGGPGEYEFIDDCDSVCADCHNRELCMVLAQQHSGKDE